MTRHPIRALTLSTFTGSFFLAACGGGGGGGGTPPPPDPLLSSLSATPFFGTPSDGLAEVVVTTTLADAAGNPLPGRTVRLEVTGLGNALVQPAATDGLGVNRGRIASSVGEKKSIVAVVDPGPNEVRLGPVTTEFLRILPNWRFVRESGADTNDGRTPLAAWRTIAFALTQLAPGDELFVGAGTYVDPLLIDMLATADAPLTIRGDRAGEFTGDAGEVLIDAGGAAAGIRLAGAAHVGLRGLSVRGSDSGAGHGGGIHATLAQDCSILDCRLYENRRGIELESCARMTLEENRISANLADGVVLAATSASDVLQNLIYENGGDAIELAAPSTALRVEFNTFFRNDGIQVRETVAGGTGTIANNVLAEGTGMGFSLAGGTSFSPASNLSWLQSGNNPAPGLIADPLFVDPFGADGILGGVGAEDDDFRMATSSPTLDAGLGNARERVLRMRGALSSLSSRSDELADGTGFDLATANLGFHYPLPVDAFGSLTPLGARVAYALPGDVYLRSRAWDRTAGVWTPALRAQALNSDVRWLVQRVSPVLQPEETVALLADTGAGTQLFVRTWDGRRWSDDAPAVASTAIPAANADERGFDLEYEALSGDALLVVADGADNALFQTRAGGRWSAAAPVFSPALHWGDVLWIELVPRPGTNEVALVALDDQQRLAATIWDGTQWTQPLLLATQVNSLHDWKSFDAAWEALSGDLLVAWGHSQFAEETRYATFTRAVDSWLTGQFVSTDALGKTLALASDPTTNRIVGIFGEAESDDDVGVSVWSGTGWSNTAELSLTGVAQSRALEIGWLGSTGRAFAIYRDQAQTGAFQWALLNSGGWRRQPEVFLPGVGRIVQSETRPVPGTERVLMLLLDETGALFAIEHDGASWILKNGGIALATGLDTTTKGRNFDLDLRRL